MAATVQGTIKICPASPVRLLTTTSMIVVARRFNDERKNM